MLMDIMVSIGLLVLIVPTESIIFSDLLVVPILIILEMANILVHQMVVMYVVLGIQV